ncbi:MAG: nucleotidyl transferase AbiEii/AbiGii toxin family protein [Nitrospirae bacterium]|nr:nucleotidyl transferase AbiEii/AbiGii toxin family protein [Nitrospirota bacterium]
MHKECFSKKGWQVFNSLKSILKKYNATLAGGTALALHLGHRISVDLDFITDTDFRLESVISDIRKTGRSFRITSEGEGYLIIEIDGIKVSLFKYDYPFLEKPLLINGVRIAQVFDIASMKVIALSQRGTKRDFIDLYLILRDIPFYKIAGHMVKRFGRERINPIHIGKSFVYFSDADSNPEPEFIKRREIHWDEVKKFFRQHVRQFVLDLDTAVGNNNSLH